MLCVPESRFQEEQLKFSMGSRRVVSAGKPPFDDTGAGVCIILSKRMATARLQDSEGKGMSCRICWVTFGLDEQGVQLVVIAAYRPYYRQMKDPDATAFDVELRKVM